VEETLVREALRHALERVAAVRIVGEAADGLDVLRLVSRLKPALVLLNKVMPGLDGLEVTRRVRLRLPNTRVVVVSRHASEAYAAEAIRSGALAYVTTRAKFSELLEAIGCAVRGERYVSSPLSQGRVEASSRKADGIPPNAYEGLTAREREVFQLAAEGYSSGRIARRLAISPRTAEAHRANAMRKLGLASRAALIRYAAERGLLPPLALPERPRGNGKRRL
jgi:DNA-binding NarL/FixJ family response regulator